MSTVHIVHKIHQILVVDEYVLPEYLPPFIQTNIDTATWMYSQAIDKTQSGMELHGFMRDHVTKVLLFACAFYVPRQLLR